MLDIVEHRASPPFAMPFECAVEDGASPEFAMLARQTHALEYIAFQLRALTGHSIELPPELQPDFEIAKRRLLEEAI